MVPPKARKTGTTVSGMLFKVCPLPSAPAGTVFFPLHFLSVFVPIFFLQWTGFLSTHSCHAFFWPPIKPFAERIPQNIPYLHSVLLMSR